jgi:uncharacterized Fe-S center protein
MNSEDPKILSDHERDSFRGQTIDEDGTVHDQKSLYEERLRQQQEAHHGIHIVEHAEALGMGSQRYDLVSLDDK